MKTANVSTPLTPQVIRVTHISSLLPKPGIVTDESFKKKSSEKSKTKAADDPLNWDPNWFGHYE